MVVNKNNAVGAGKITGRVLTKNDIKGLISDIDTGIIVGDVVIYNGRVCCVEGDGSEDFDFFAFLREHSVDEENWNSLNTRILVSSGGGDVVDDSESETTFLDGLTGGIGRELIISNKGYTKKFNQNSVNIGRSIDGNDFVVDTLSVSRYHCKIYLDSDGFFYLKDLGSSNGTVVEGRRLGRSDSIRLDGNVDVVLGNERINIRVV